jgi:chromosomal replication initiation ATPase DnaA
MNNTPLPPIGEIYTYAKIAADAYQLSTHDLQAEDRKQPRAFARQVAMHLAVTHGRHTRDDVAAYFRKQYATVTHAISRVDDELQTSAAFRMLYTNIKRKAPKQ